MAVTGRRGARRLLVQALYQRQLTGHSPAELLNQFAGRDEYAAIDTAYFGEMLKDILADTVALDALLATDADRPPVQFDPVEHGILWLGAAELKGRPEVPVKVVINEAVELAKEFGAQDSHRYVNALLDKLAARLR